MMLEEMLKKYARSDIYPFHMPGHKRAELDFTNPYSIDITEIEGFDNLHHAEGVLKEAQEAAAELYGSRRAYYLVNGSTCGILAAISAAVPRGGRILVSRNCHKAVYNAIYLRQLSAEYIYPAETRCGIQGQITVEQVRRRLEECPDVKAVVITSPTYDGIVSDVAGIAEEVHRLGIPLIVDEAHGAHFGFHPAFPENAVKYADAVIMSVHKTLPAFTQTALLHLCSDRIDQVLVQRFLGIYETSSPSYILMAGIEKSLSIVKDQGEELFDRYVAMLRSFREEVRDLKHLWVLGAGDFSGDEAWAFDIGKLPIISRCAVSGQKLQDRLLRDYGLEMEMASGNYVLALTSVMDRQEGFDRLSAALHEVDADLPFDTSQAEKITPQDLYREPDKVMEIYEAQEAEHETLPLEQVVGRVSADTVFLYPPGIPVLVPGERIDRQTSDNLRQCLCLGLDVQGLSGNDSISIVKNR